MIGLVPKTTKTDVKIAFGISLERLIILMMTLLFSVMISDYLIHPKLRIAFPIVMMIYAYIYTSRDYPHPKRKIWQATIILLRYMRQPKYMTSLSRLKYRKEDMHDPEA